MRSLTISTFCNTFFNTFSMTLSKTTYRAILLSSFIWCLFILAGPMAHYFHASGVEDFIYRLFSRICHQLDARSLHLFGAKLAVCARCTSIYFAFLLSVVFYPLLVKRRRFTFLTRETKESPRALFLSILPLLLDVVLSETGVHQSTLITRVVTGMIFGITLPFILIPPADNALKELRLKLSQSLWRTTRHAE